MITATASQDFINGTWDGAIPQKMREKLGPMHEIFESPGNITFSEVLPYMDHLKGFAKQSKFGSRSFYMTFSGQNLRRLAAQFPSVDWKNGLDLIAEKKRENKAFFDMIRKSADIKEGKFDVHIPYKVPPLAPYQHKAAVFLTETKRAPLFADCGLGKTWAVLVSTEEQIRRGLVRPGKVLVCGKLATLETGWLEDTRKFTDLTAKLLWLPGSGEKRRKRLRELLSEPADIYVINHDGVRVYEKELAEMNFEKVVVDESTILKGFRGMRGNGGEFGKALMNVSHSAEWRVIMSGTPAPNDASDLWGQIHFLDPDGFLLERSYSDFMACFMEETMPLYLVKDQAPRGPMHRLKRGAREAISEIVMPLAFRARIRDHLSELPEKTVIKRLAPMGKEQQEHYDDMKRLLSTEIEGEFVSVDSKLTQIMKLRQITGGFLIDQEEEAHEIKANAKAAALDGIICDEIAPEEKVIIYCQYQWEIRFIADKYKELGVVTVYGGNSSAQNLENIKAFIQNPRVKIIVLHPKSAAHGLTFTHCHYMIFYSISYSAEDDYQCVKRIERAGQKHPMCIYYLLAKSANAGEMSIDQIIFQVIQSKTKSQDQLISDRDVSEEIYTQVRKSFHGETGKTQTV